MKRQFYALVWNWADWLVTNGGMIRSWATRQQLKQNMADINENLRRKS